MPTLVTDRLERNLRALAQRSPAAAEAIARASLPAGVTLLPAADGHITAEDTRDGTPRLLASAQNPELEAKNWADAIDIAQAAVIAVRGAGLWHHLFVLADRMKRTGAIVVYEPDVSLLKLVLGHIDITPLLAALPVSLVVDAADMGQISSSLEGTEGMVATGLLVVDHPPSRSRLGLHRASDPNASTSPARLFAQNLTGAVQAVRTSVVTTLVQIETTIENLLGNFPAYIDGHGIADLANSEQGKPAIVVSAGPSLRKNIDLLAQPGVRDRVVIIAVQTVLKQLLARGVKPHYVTALDYHPISTRFYEGLTAKDVAGVTLVIDPKAHPAIARAFPGTVRTAGSELLDNVLGSLAKPMGEVAAGATVAHLAYYLAKHLGCRTIILMGQDLGFTDNQYYSAGAAIHNVWSSELSDIATLESLEWQRIVRMRALLRKAPAAAGGELYADEQMHTYRVQFERDFERDTRAGYTIIDATEGGARKQHTTIMPLARALRECATSAPRPAKLAPPPHVVSMSQRTSLALERLQALEAAAKSVHSACSQAHDVLNELLAMLSPTAPPPIPAQVDALITKAHTHARSTAGNIALWFVEHLNQIGQLKRFKADRKMLLAQGLDPISSQRQQVERDLLNVQWLRDTALRASELLRWAHDNTLRIARGQAPIERVRGESSAEASADTESTNTAQSRVFAFLHTHPTRSMLGVPRSWTIASPGSSSQSVLACTLRKLLAVPQLAGIAIAVSEHHEAALRSHLQEHDVDLARVRVLVHNNHAQLAKHASSLRAARSLHRHSWRGGAGQLCVYDELLCPKVDSQLIEQLCTMERERNPQQEAQGTAPTALLLVGDDWCALDTDLCAQVIRRHQANPTRHRVTFTQAPPGLCGIVVDCALVHEFAQQQHTAGSWWSTLGGMLGYYPSKPQMDAIAKDICVAIPSHVRDTLLRCACDDANFRHIFARAVASDAAALQWSASQWCEHVQRIMKHVAQLAHHDASHQHTANAPEHQTHLLPERVSLDARALTNEDLPSVVERVARMCEQQPALTLSVDVGEQAGNVNWPALIDACVTAGVWAVHLRMHAREFAESTLHEHASQGQASQTGDDLLATLLAAPIDLLSVALPGDSEESFSASWQASSSQASSAQASSSTYRESVWNALQLLLDRVHAKSAPGSLPTRWLAAHMPKSKATLADMELFYDRWMLACGCAVIEGEGEYALPLPAHVLERRSWSTLDLSASPLRASAAGRGTTQHAQPAQHAVFDGRTSHDATSQLEGAI